MAIIGFLLVVFLLLYITFVLFAARIVSEAFSGDFSLVGNIAWLISLAVVGWLWWLLLVNSPFTIAVVS